MAAKEAKPDAPSDRATSDRQKALDSALAQIERQFGKGSVIKMSDKQAQVIEVIPTGSVALDIALGIGGLPRGRIVEIYGPESSVRQLLPCMQSQAHRSSAESAPLSMQSTHLMQSMQRSSVLISMLSLFHNQIQVNKHLRLWICWSVQVLSISLLLTLLQRLFHALKLKARW